MQTVFGDDIRVRREDDGSLYLKIKLAHAHDYFLFPLAEYRHSLNNYGDLLDNMLTRCSNIEATLMPIKELVSYVDLFDFKSTVRIKAVKIPTAQSSEDEVMAFLTTLVYNINMVALEVHGAVVNSPNNKDWLELD